MFQTQLKFAEEQATKVSELEKKLADLTASRIDSESLQREIEDLKSQLNSKNAIIQSNVTADNDKARLQTAVNNQMKEIDSLKTSIEELQKEQKDQQNYIAQLEEMLPNSKKKKLGITVVEEPTTPEVKKEEPVLEKSDNDVLKFTSSGGTF
jgi:predicted RNase H-like nuclease (RuvC/YqgF family)